MNNNFYMIGHLEIPQRQILNTPLWYLDTNNREGVYATFQKIKEMTNYKFDNTHLKWSNIYGELFTINIHYSKYDYTWEISIWDSSGSIALETLNQIVENKTQDVISKQNYDSLRHVTERFSNGYLKCSGCGKEIEIQDIAGSYFAGRYCTTCWEDTYREIEAKETYN